MVTFRVVSLVLNLLATTILVAGDDYSSCSFYDTEHVDIGEGEYEPNECHHDMLPNASVLDALTYKGARVCCLDPRAYVFHDNCEVSGARGERESLVVRIISVENVRMSSCALSMPFTEV